MAPRVLPNAGLSPLSAFRKGLPEPRGTLQPACGQMVSLASHGSRLALAACHCKSLTASVVPRALSHFLKCTVVLKAQKLEFVLL